MKDITDGTASTIMIVERDDAHAPSWTKPDDLPFDPKRPAQGLGRLYARDGYYAAFCDGSVRFLATTIPDDALRALFTKSGGEPRGD